MGPLEHSSPTTRKLSLCLQFLTSSSFFSPSLSLILRPSASSGPKTRAAFKSYVRHICSRFFAERRVGSLQEIKEKIGELRAGACEGPHLDEEKFWKWPKVVRVCVCVCVHSGLMCVCECAPICHAQSGMMFWWRRRGGDSRLQENYSLVYLCVLKIYVHVWWWW